MQAKTGDKVRLKIGTIGARGIIEAVRRDTLVIALAQDNRRVTVSPAEITNYSLAARRAWKNMPKRRVGRPKGSRLCDRVSVTLRIDRELWCSFQRLETDGLVNDRTSTINRWLREKLNALTEGKSLTDGQAGK